MKQAVTRDLYSYWNRLRADRAAPARLDVDPADISGLLNDTFILETGLGGGFPIRIAGARIAALFLSEIKGLPFPRLFHADDRQTLVAFLDSVVDDPTPVVAGVTAGPIGSEPVEMELLLLPLQPDAGERRQILGSLAPSSRPGWVGLIAVEPLRLTSLRVLRDAGGCAAARLALDPANWSTLPLSEAKSGGNAAVRQPHLTLYNS